MRHPNMVGGIINLCTLVSKLFSKRPPAAEKEQIKKRSNEIDGEKTQIVRYAMREGNAFGL
jgi:hypothetical protein